MKIIKKAVLPCGFKASGIFCGLKKSGRLDLALFYSTVPARAKAMFTTNKMAAAPVIVSKDHLRKGTGFQAIIANSANANCFTGKRGIYVAQRTTEALARNLGIDKNAVLVNSTGVIGKQLDFSKIYKAIPSLCSALSEKGIDNAKKAIMTTDRFPKEITVKSKINGAVVSICGVAKGAGMIAPDMATMFAFIFTDAHIADGALKKALKDSVSGSFNCISVDGCMSTNDSVIVLANSKAANRLITDKNGIKQFTEALSKVCLELAKMIVIDGEGASKLIKIKVSSAKDQAEAKKAALAIANSNLFKTAMYGSNPNFGRIVASVGATGIDVKEKDLKVRLGPLKGKEVDVFVSLGRGSAECTVYTSDLTPKYIKINAAYN